MSNQHGTLDALCRIPHPLTPREKVAQIIKEKVSGPHFTDPSHFVAMEQDRFIAADAIITALASGSGDQSSGNPGILKSGDHAELADLLDLQAVLRADRLPECSFDDGKTWELDGVGVAETFSRAADTLEAILAENSALRAANTEAERKLAEAVEAMEEIAAIEPKPFEGGLDMESIRACEECRRYEGHPVQHGICNTHRRPIWDREKHEGHEEKALGYRAKSIARTFLSKEAERG
ncbi:MULTISPECIES: hypothetical protein [Brevundimonas]|uniref:hypothetical protein n=1 Tax=Brevundimonas sp. UBA7507 TaxID=1946137 RepID=UPI00257A5B8D|nr:MULTISPECIES: hypothetical protein [Brevundimonas]